MALQKLKQEIDEKVGEGSFQKAGADVAQFIHQKVIESDEDVRDAVDVLHGKPFGHPLHPVLTDITIGSWTLGVMFDVLAFFTRSSQARQSGDTLVTLGTLSAVPTALAGIADYSGIKKDSAGHAAAHGLLNGLALFCFARSVIARNRQQRGTALFFSLVGLSIATASAWLGGDMVYRKKVGVNHAPEGEVENWTAVMTAKELIEGVPARIEVDEQYVLLYREGSSIYAIGAICSHASGPLEQGTFKDGCVECPWHQSVYSLRDGHVVHGPSAFDQPRFSARVHNGKIEVRSFTGEENYAIQVDTDDSDAPEVEVEVAMPHTNGTAKKSRSRKNQPPGA